ncbi:MAG TPA: hypothetical protein VN081_05715 [Dongiaceae bacterium]|nr:hypothetical protein [Dongiaceae bacterium]
MTTNNPEMLHLVEVSPESTIQEMAQEVLDAAERLKETLGQSPMDDESEAAEIVRAAIQQLEITLDSIETRETLQGVEEMEIHPMFETVLRYLTLTRRYEPVSVEELFDHLKRNHLIEQTDTSDTVLDEVLGWADVIERDAAELGRPGSLVYDEATDMIGFAAPNEEILHLDFEQQRARRIGKTSVLRALDLSVQPHEAGEEHKPIEPPLHLVEEEHETMTEPEDLAVKPEYPPYTTDEVRTAIQEAIDKSSKGDIKQTELKQALIALRPSVTHEDLQPHIDLLCEQGVFKKVRLNKLMWLRVSDGIIEASPKDKENEINIPTAISILRTLTASGIHPQQRFEVSDIWRSMGNSGRVPEGIANELRRQCRLLSKKGLVAVEQMKRKGGSQLSRSATHQVFKVGIASSEVKRQFQAAIDSKNEQVITYLIKNGLFVLE